MKLFSESEIQEIYNSKVNLPDSYFSKYYEVPKCPVKSWNYSWDDRDFPRVWCLLDFKEWIEKHNIAKGQDLAITCHNDPELEFLDYKSVDYFPYPGYDLHIFKSEKKFDFFLFNQTIEHLYNPFVCIQNIFEVIKPGGYVFTSVPTLNFPHIVPFHFNGYTPMGLAILFKNAGFEVVEIGQWGNHEYINKLWGNQMWPGYNSLQRNNKVSNERLNVCQCWILAKKPLE
jgi:SAM-dependent methyltransferase